MSDLDNLREAFTRAGFTIVHDTRQRKTDEPRSRSTAYIVKESDRYSDRLHLVWDLDENNNVLSFMVCH